MSHGRRSRLTYVVNSLVPGGAERLVVDMALALSDEFDLSVVCLDEPGAWAVQLRDADVPVSCLWRQPGLDLAVSARLARYTRERGTDIVHAHQATAWFYSAGARLQHARPKLLFQEHGRFFPEPDKPARRLVNRHLVRRLTDGCVAVSRDIKWRLVRYEGLRPDDIQVIYNGVKPVSTLSHEDRQHLRASLGFHPGHFVVGTVGRFDPIKNLPMLVSALQSAGAQLPNLRGLLVGDGPAWPQIRELVANAGLEGEIVLSGHRDDARSIVQCLDLFVLSSLSEGTSMALLEAIAAGVPVVVTDVGGNAEVVQDGVTGWVVPSEDIAALTRVILQASSDEVVRRRFSGAGTSRLRERFEFKGMVNAYRALYGSLVS